ncbi:ABC transporter ATP-binding protein [Enterococcus sp. AZ103]|uniref:ABC transporter ATP-binding protein n=1 Tax=Enterococcus sp. AZ103 TaxID=2774628 RepID=UPI003F276816
MSNEIIAEMMHAHKSFNKHTVLQDVSIVVERGTIVGLIGPSGAGKTTTIKCMMGMEKLDKGSTEIFNTTMPNRKILEKIGYMGQSDALYENLTAKENLQFFGKLMGLKKSNLTVAIQENLSLVNLTDSENVLVQNFSGGMKRRLSLATALLAQPELLVLDEPTVGIDPSLRVEIWNQLRKIASEDNSIIITTHVMDEAEKCDLVGLIIDGQVFAIGTPTELKAQFNVDTIEDVFLKAEVKVK